MKKLIYLFLILLIGCTTEEVQQIQTEEDVTSAEQSLSGGATIINYAGMDLTVSETDSVYVLEGDIMFPKSRSNNKAAIRTTGLWKDNTMIYDIDPNLDNPSRVFDAMAHWEANTNIKFQRRTTETDYVYFTPGLGCSSYIGRIGGRQNIHLHSACSVGNTVHEIGHAAGMWHEQSRSDRDNYVIIHWNNIVSGASHNFNKATGETINTKEIDFGSIMMYSPYSFSSNGYPTITKKDGSTYRVQRSSLSEGDIYGVNLVYPEVSQPEYINGEYYRVYGVWVLRKNNKWWYWSRLYGQWKEVYARGPYWYYVK